MMLSKNFSLAEMLESQTATRFGVSEQFRPSKIVVDNLTLLCTHILQPLRDKLGTPIRISSGYRHKRTNELVGGASTSQHVRGQAADLISADPNVSNATIFETIQRLNLPFDQLIWEFGTKLNPSWVHVSYGERHRRQVLYVPNHLKP
jgi:zinc D-Ala-D-Ala carboxypeptidase